jgi:peptide deformylase
MGIPSRRSSSSPVPPGISQHETTIPPHPMAIYPIRTFGDPVLRLETKPIADIDKTVHTLAQDMIETMYDAPGVGLAANQIGISRRIAVFDAQDELGPRVMINPEVVETTGEFEMEEGCLSVPGHWWEITRPAFARVKALDLDGNEIEYAGDGLLGRVLQHEVAHLYGGLLIDALSRRERKKALRELRNENLGLT